MVDGVNETTSSQNSIYNLSLSDLSTLNLDDKTEKAIRKYFAKHDITNEDTLDLSTYDKDNNGIIDDDERKEAGLKKSVVNAFNKILQVKSKIIADKLANEQEIMKFQQYDVKRLKVHLAVVEHQIDLLEWAASLPPGRWTRGGKSITADEKLKFEAMSIYCSCSLSSLKRIRTNLLEVIALKEKETSTKSD